MAGKPQVDAGSAGYVTDVAYLRNFVEDMAPLRMRLGAALNGFAPPPSRGFAYGELGSGNGDTIAALAAACPDARFVGVDVNTEHVTFATGLATRGQLDNLRFVEGDFADLPEHDLPDFDYLGAHGVLSWISAEKRRALVAFAARKLKPGGLLYVSYNALPGWAAIEPLRRMLLDSSAGVAGSTVDRARHGVSLATLLNDGGAAYFTDNPTARTMLQTMAKAGLAYVAHEYFHEHWSPMYFADVAREMAAGDLYFIGQLPPYLNYRDITVPPGLVQLFKGIENRVAFETYKDLALNEFFRRDLYIKGRAPCSPATTTGYFESTPFGAPAGRILREVRLPHYNLQFAGPIFDALIPVLTAQAATLPELVRRPDLASFGAPALRDALVRLALGDQILPMAESTEPLAAPAPGPRSYGMPLPFNRMILAQKLSHRNLVTLASPRAGTGVVLPMLQAVSAHLLTAVEPAARAAWIHTFVAEHVLKLYDGERLITDRQEQTRVLLQQLEAFTELRVPELLRMGIFEER